MSEDSIDKAHQAIRQARQLEEDDKHDAAEEHWYAARRYYVEAGLDDAWVEEDCSSDPPRNENLVPNGYAKNSERGMEYALYFYGELPENPFLRSDDLPDNLLAVDLDAFVEAER
jgi:hypothetical protein